MSSSLSSPSYDAAELARAFSRLSEEQGNAVLALLRSFGISVGGGNDRNKTAQQQQHEHEQREEGCDQMIKSTSAPIAYSPSVKQPTRAKSYKNSSFDINEGSMVKQEFHQDRREEVERHRSAKANTSASDQQRSLKRKANILRQTTNDVIEISDDDSCRKKRRTSCWNSRFGDEENNNNKGCGDETYESLSSSSSISTKTDHETDAVPMQQNLCSRQSSFTSSLSRQEDTSASTAALNQSLKISKSNYTTTNALAGHQNNHNKATRVIKTEPSSNCESRTISPQQKSRNLNCDSLSQNEYNILTGKGETANHDTFSDGTLQQEESGSYNSEYVTPDKKRDFSETSKNNDNVTPKSHQRIRDEESLVKIVKVQLSLLIQKQLAKDKLKNNTSSTTTQRLTKIKKSMKKNMVRILEKTAKSIAGSSGTDKLKQQEVFTVLMEHREKFEQEVDRYQLEAGVQEEITFYQESKSVDNESLSKSICPVDNTKKSQPSSSNMFNDHKGVRSCNDEKNNMHCKKHKDSKVLKSSFTKMEHNDDHPIPSNQSKLTPYLKAKKEFEEEKQKILAQIPEDVKSGFRQIGFCRQGHLFLPVLEISPFDVEPGKFRDKWLEVFERTKKEKNKRMPRFVYWYGNTMKTEGNSCSFIHTKNILPYEKGVTKGYHILPDKVQKKLESSKKLTKFEKKITLALDQLKDEIEKSPSDRIEWIVNFEEKYESLK